MKGIIIKNLKFSYGNSLVLNDINMEIEEGKSISIIGTKGKTTLLKLLDFKLRGTGEIFINGIKMDNDNFRMLSKYYSIIYKDDNFKEKYVKDEIIIALEMNSSNMDSKDTILNKCLAFFNIKSLLSLEVARLSRIEKYLLKVVCALLKNPKYLALDDILCEFDDKLRKNIFTWCKENGITIINVTSEMETVMDTQFLYCLYNGSIILSGEIPYVFEEEKIIRRLGYKLPFIVDMSIQLGCYDLVHGFYNNKEDLVKDVWK